MKINIFVAKTNRRKVKKYWKNSTKKFRKINKNHGQKKINYVEKKSIKNYEKKKS